MKSNPRKHAVLAALASSLLVLPSALASHTPAPASVTVAGSLQSELGCPGDWQPECAATRLADDDGDGVWKRAFAVPAGDWEYKAALNGGWDENYGRNAVPGGANVALSLPAATTVRFYYSHASHWTADSKNVVIATAPGSYQSELGCSGDWQPGCLRSWLQDPDGDGVYTFETRALPAGSYEVKVAIDESWDENYGAGGTRNGANVAFTVRETGVPVLFSYDAASHVLTVRTTTHRSPGNVERDGLRHDSRDTLYRAPGGAVAAGRDVAIRFRTFHDDVTDVKLRLYDTNASAQRIVGMKRVAEDVSCYGVAGETCDFWEYRLGTTAPNVYWYRFVVSDEGDTDHYADDTAALDGGAGAVSDDARDWSYALTVYDPQFRTPAWTRDAVVYQVFPDRFANGDAKNDPKTGDTRYDDPALKLGWGTLPEGYCRNYAVPDSQCAWRYDATPPSWSPNREQPRGRDYFGGDLKGLRQKLDYLDELGVDAIYLNPIFAARSNHRYDTADYGRIDPYLGDLKEFELLVKQARARGIRVILDGVFNHMSSDSPFFDRYHHYATLGACESLASPFRAWFVFNNDNVPCTGADYKGWFGFDSIPEIRKTNPAVQEYFLTGAGSIAKLWLERGAGGWRMDVSSDPSFPPGYWETFRGIVKTIDPDALTVAEAWQKDTTTLRSLNGPTFDSTMNYRLRDAILGFLSPGPFDSKGFADSGRILRPTEVAERLLSIREDLPDASYYALLNLLDSHDTERIRWSLTPGPESRAGRELDAANVADGRRRHELAALMQFAMPGAPLVYYGDEAGVTGDDDPDDRRTFPWPNTGGRIDEAQLAFYRSLTALRHDGSALTRGDFAILAADDAAGTLAWSRTTATKAAVAAVNRSDAAASVAIPYAGCAVAVAVGGAAVAGGVATLPPRSGVICTAAGDFEPPPAPAGLRVTAEGSGSASVAWDAVDGAAGYAVYRSPVTGGGYGKVADASGTSFVDSGLRNATPYHYVVRAVDPAGNASDPSNEVHALPHLAIGWANTQWPPSIRHTVSTTNRTEAVYGQVWIDGETSRAGPTPSLLAQLGYGPDGTEPAGTVAWRWIDAEFNGDAGNNDEFKASLLPDAVGEYDYAYRYSTTGGRDWVYAELDGTGNGYSPASAGALSVVSSGDTTPPAPPTNLRRVSASPTQIELAWDGVADAYGYEVRRADAAAGPYATLGLVTGTAFADTDVEQGRTYHYVVRSVDDSFNRSADSPPLAVAAELRLVQVVFTVEVPPTTDPRVVNIAGTLNRLDPPRDEWNPGGTPLTRLDATHWRITLRGFEGAQLEYKYALGSWDFVEKDAACGEIGNRQLTLTYGATGTQDVANTVPNWRNVPPCGN